MPLEVREAWLAQVEEPVVEPGRRIIDPHHHFFAPGGPFPAYGLDDLWADTATHGVEQTVYLQCGEGYRQDGPEALRCVGETEWVEAIVRRAAQRPDAAQIGAIIATAELRAGRTVHEVLEAHRAASPRFRGIRQIAAWDADPAPLSFPGLDGPDLYDDRSFREGFAVLAEMGLVFDAYHFHPQTPGLTRLARDFPTVPIVLNHLGTPLGVGVYATQREAVFAQWQRDLAALAACPNVSVKLGGLAMPWNGFGFDEAPRPPTSDEVVERQARYYHYAIEQFGAERCMFESNFPVDKVSLSYTVLWNAFKKMAARYPERDQALLFAGTAERVYRL